MFIYIIEESNGQDEESSRFVLTNRKKFTADQFAADVQVCRDQVAGITASGRQRKSYHIGFYRISTLLETKYGYKLISPPIVYI